MSLIDDIIAADAAAFVDPDSMPGGEAVTYTKVGGTTRNIYVNVDRQPPERLDPSGDVFRPLMTIDVINSSTTGIALSELNTGGDTITIAYYKGGSAVAHPIVKGVIIQDAGMLRLELG